MDGRISALLELGAGFNPEYSGVENVYLNGTMMGFSKEEVDARLRDILDFADIGDFVYQPVKSYSSGMFVRLAFAVAINIDPEILIVDEALSVGDVFFQAKCYRKFEEFKEMGRTILFVSHDLSSISHYCDRVILLNKGVKLDEGSPKQMVDMYKQLLVGQEPARTDRGEEAEGTATEAAADEEQPWHESFQINPDLLEYGSKLAEIIDFVVADSRGRYTNTIEKGDTFQIRMRVKFHESIQEPIMAYTFKDIRGRRSQEPIPCLKKPMWRIPKQAASVPSLSRRICFYREESIFYPLAAQAIRMGSLLFFTDFMTHAALRWFPIKTP